MEGLIASDFTDFIRIGVVSKISTPILPYSLYSTSESGDGKSPATELENLSALTTSASDAETFR